MTTSSPLLRRVAVQLSSCLFALLATAPATAAADGTGNSIQIKVVGSLVPPACNLTMPAGSTVDYGRMLHSQLSTDSHTLLPEQKLTFSINCDAPAKVALLLQDEHPATIVQDLIKAVRDEPDANFMANGLGSVNGVNIGIFYVRVSTGSGRNVPGTLRTLRSDGMRGWSETPVDAPLYANGIYAVGFSEGQAALPTAFNTVSGELAIQTLIRPSAELPSVDEIVLAGSSTLTLYYQ
ncbi:DUF1120 domain-containing protein [Herbaspirillum sp. YR522]|uniref:DUF1120 domain-containing protein n=1 Tax=Herbaspirillum sp. YR522 TaxID=1144342 RepID=UPI00026F8831|nr:DUF1120 domain-containing protein [Herbaspirillum sp. YR522]EJN06920.1 Protein of unknown function (DUF1120) [Herbaspirillum sp. YR522]